jgi:hypothetical protein
MIERFVKHNPVLWQENTRFQRTSWQWRRWERPISILLAVIGLLLIVHLWSSAVAFGASRSTRSTAMFFALLVVWMFHTVVVVRSIIAGVTVINREYVGQTWDSLVLTGISTRSILLGKLRAALRTVLPWMLLLMIFRVTLLPLMSYYVVQRVAVRCYVNLTGGNNAYGGYDTCPGLEWVPWAWLVAPLITAAITLLEVVACVSLGLAASAITRSSVSAAVVALSTRFLPIATFIGFARYELGDTWLFRYLRFAPFTIADAGTSGLIQLVYPLTSWTAGNHAGTLPTLLAVALMLGAITLGSWGIALWAIHRRGALSQAQATQPLTAQPAYSVFRLG